MKAIEQWILRVADSDWTWIGLNWLRPARDAHIGYGYIIFSSILLGLPGIAVGGSLIYVTVGNVSLETWFFLFAAVTVFELFMHIACAHFWNRRAAALAKHVPIG